MTNTETIDTTSLNLNADQIEAMTLAVKSAFDITALERLSTLAAMGKISQRAIMDASAAVRNGKTVNLASIVVLFHSLSLTSLDDSQVNQIVSTGVLKAIRPVTSNL